MMAAQEPLILVVTLGLLASSLQAAPQPLGPTSAPTFVDVALRPGGGVTGRFLDAHGDAIAGAQATLVHGDEVVEVTHTLSDGTYHFRAAGPGVYRVSLHDQWQAVRIWDSATRPPSASDLLTIVRQEQIVRGQTISNSLVGQIGLGIGIASAFAAGVAISESYDDQQDTADLRRLMKTSSP